MSRRRKILMFTMILLVLVVLASVVRHFQLRWSLEVYISKLKSEGEPLSLAQVIPHRSPPGGTGTPAPVRLGCGR